MDRRNKFTLTWVAPLLSTKKANDLSEIKLIYMVDKRGDKTFRK